MARKTTVIVDELFDKLIHDPKELKYHVKVLLQACHEAGCKQSVRVFGVNRKSPSGLIKGALMSRKQPEVDYQIRTFATKAEI